MYILISIDTNVAERSEETHHWNVVLFLLFKEMRVPPIAIMTLEYKLLRKSIKLLDNNSATLFSVEHE